MARHQDGIYSETYAGTTYIVMVKKIMSTIIISLNISPAIMKQNAEMGCLVAYLSSAK